MTNLKTTTLIQSPAQSVPVHTMDSSVLLWFRKDMSREAARSYWMGGHAQLVARNPAVSDYRQHHFDPQSSGLWPSTENVETAIPVERRVDGMPEVRLKGLVPVLLNNSYGKRVLSDEVNVFHRTILYATAPGGGRWFRSGYDEPVGFRCVALIKKNPSVSNVDFKRFVHEELAPLLNGAPGVLELRSQVFLPWKRSMWDSPGVAHDNSELDQFHASLVIGTDSRENLLAALHVAADKLRDHQARYCKAIHAYEVEDTYTFCRGGRPTLPQVKPERRAEIEPVKREIAPAPERAKQSSSKSVIRKALRLPISGATPEDVVTDEQGRLLCGVADGRILRIDPRTRIEETLCSTGGRPLGLELGTDGRLLICDAHKGLLAYDFEDRTLTSLVQFVNTIPMRFCSNATMSRDGTIWFTESTTRFDFEQHGGAFLEHRPSGRLLRRDPNGDVTVILNDLYFPNGLTLNSDESAVLFVETAGYRMSRLWVKGERSGQCEVIVENLPGMPDNVSRMKDGRFWVAMVSARNPGLDSLAKSSAAIRKLIWAITAKRPPKPKHMVWAMSFNEEGEILADLQSTEIAFSEVTSITESNGKLYCGTVAPDVRALLEIDLASIS